MTPSMPRSVPHSLPEPPPLPFRPPRPSLLSALDALVGLVAPPECAACTAPGAVLCEPCTAAMDAAAREVLLPGRPHGPPASACAPYEGAVRTCIAAWKERGRHDLEPLLGAALARAVLALPPHDLPPHDLPPHDLPTGSPIALVPVPASRAARRRRGADGVHRLALHAASRLRSVGRPARVYPVLRLARAVADQAGLSATQRERNVAGAFALRHGARVPDGAVVVVDDVLTTGATVRSALTALEAAGGHVVGVSCVSVTPLRRGLSAPDEEG